MRISKEEFAKIPNMTVKELSEKIPIDIVDILCKILDCRNCPTDEKNCHGECYVYFNDLINGR